MAKKDEDIQQLMNPIIIRRTPISQVRVIAYKYAGREQVWINIKEFCKYLNWREREAGIQFEDAPYKPSSSEGVTFRLESIDKVIGALQTVREEISVVDKVV